MSTYAARLCGLRGKHTIAMECNMLESWARGVGGLVCVVAVAACGVGSGCSATGDGGDARDAQAARASAAFDASATGLSFGLQGPYTEAEVESQIQARLWCDSECAPWDNPARPMVEGAHRSGLWVVDALEHDPSADMQGARFVAYATKGLPDDVDAYKCALLIQARDVWWVTSSAQDWDCEPLSAHDDVHLVLHDAEVSRTPQGALSVALAMIEFKPSKHFIEGAYARQLAFGCAVRSDGVPVCQTPITLSSELTASVDQGVDMYHLSMEGLKARFNTDCCEQCTPVSHSECAWSNRVHLNEDCTPVDHLSPEP